MGLQRGERAEKRTWVGDPTRRATPCASAYPAPCASVHLAPRSPRGRRAPRSPQAGANGLAKQASRQSQQIDSPPRRGRRAHAPPVPRLPRGTHVPRSPCSCAGGRAKQLAFATGSLPPLGPSSLPFEPARIRSGRRRAGTPKRMRFHQPQRSSCMNAPDDQGLSGRAENPCFRTCLNRCFARRP